MTDDTMPPSATPRVDNLIEAAMARYPGEKGRYYEKVHQELAPLARQLELQNLAMRRSVHEMLQGADDATPAERIAKFDQAVADAGKVRPPASTKLTSS